MALSGTQAADRVKGWVGFFLALVPILKAVPEPHVQAALSPINDFLIALFGAGGVGLLSTNPAIMGKKKPQ